MRQTLKRAALALGIGFALLVITLVFWLWDNRRVRVHNAEQAVAMAKAEAGPQVASLPMRVEPVQDFWTVRFGPDEKGQMHNYIVTIWDKRAGLLLEEVTDVAIVAPR